MSISKYQLLFHWKSFENIWSFILYLEEGEIQLINACVVPFAIAEFSQKCLEAASTLKYEPLNSCITVHSVWIMKIFNVMRLNSCSCYKRRKNCEESRWRSQNALVWPLAMPCLNRCQDLIGYQASTHSNLQPYWLLQQTSEHTKSQSHIATATKIHTLTPLAYELFWKQRCRQLVLGIAILLLKSHHIERISVF